MRVTHPKRKPTIRVRIPELDLDAYMNIAWVILDDKGNPAGIGAYEDDLVGYPFYGVTWRTLISDFLLDAYVFKMKDLSSEERKRFFVDGIRREAERRGCEIADEKRLEEIAEELVRLISLGEYSHRLVQVEDLLPNEVLNEFVRRADS